MRRLKVGAPSGKLDNFSYLNRIIEILSLDEIEIHGADGMGREMYVLPNQLQHLTALKSLEIDGFMRMEALPEWLGDLQSLQSLSLKNSTRLRYESTAPFMLHLLNLRHLYIYNCYCLKKSEALWMDIASLTKIRVDIY